MMLMPLSGISSMCTGNTWNAGTSGGKASGGRTSKVRVSSPTTAAFCLTRYLAPERPTPAAASPLYRAGADQHRVAAPDAHALVVRGLGEVLIGDGEVGRQWIAVPLHEARDVEQHV